jgi:outer membrane protein insertion porin family
MKRFVCAVLVAAALVSTAGARYTFGNDAPVKWTVKSISFSGNSTFDAGRLRGVMVTQASGFMSSHPFHQSILEGDIRGLRLFYERQGYLQADVAGYEVKRDSARAEVAITVTISEGPLTRLEKVTVFGNTIFTDRVILDRIGMSPGDPFRQKAVEDAVSTLMGMYADRGYLEGEVKPDVHVNPETHLAIVDFLITEKDQFRIADIPLEGLVKTKPGVVRRELLFHRGDIIEYTDLLKSQRRLYLTGLFGSVFIRPRSAAGGDSATKDILVEIKESESIELAAGIGYGSVEQARGSFEISNHNIRGTALKMALSGEASLIGRGVEASFTDPWILGIPIRTDVSVTYKYLDEPGYDLERKAASLSVGRGLGERARVSLAWNYVDDGLLRVEVEEVPEDLSSNLRTLSLSVVYDARDDIANTTQGIYSDWTGDLTGGFLGGTEDFTRSTFGVRYFRRLTSHAIVASAFEVGWIENRDAARAVPLGQRFYAGGPNTLRGFEYELVGPLDRNRKPVGGLFETVLNLIEIRQDLYKMLGVAVFADVGNVWSEVRAFHLEDFRTSAGGGMRVNTPIGILRGDVGVNLAPRDREPRTVFYFSVGQAF